MPAGPDDISLSRPSQLRAWLENEISEGHFRPGDRLDEQELCKRFGVSRTPVREALLQLASLGLVIFRPRQGAEITRLSVKQIAAMLEVLAKLEGYCAQLAARRMTRDEQDRLRSILLSFLPMVEAKDVAGYDEANHEFHEAIYAGARNEFLASQVRDIRRRLRMYRRNPFQRPGGMERSYAGHHRVAEAIVAGDDAGAEAAMHEHVIGAVGLMDFLAELPDDPGQPSQPSDSNGSSVVEAPRRERGGARKTTTRKSGPRRKSAVAS
ncbi:transcriptional regulator, GntR family [Azospirillum lipoferum]|nr:transcriptional regulator, GntR family [Azospirillum lipoferum]